MKTPHTNVNHLDSSSLTNFKDELIIPLVSAKTGKPTWTQTRDTHHQIFPGLCINQGMSNIPVGGTGNEW